MYEEIPLTLSELQDILRCDPDTLAGLVAIKDFPVIVGRVFWSDFEVWRRSHLKLVRPSQQTQLDHEPRAGRTVSGRSGKSGLRDASRLRGEFLHAEAASL